MLLTVCCILMSNIPHQWIVWITVCQKGTDGKEHFGNGESRTPVVFQNVQTYHTLTVDVTMVDTCLENHLGWFEWVVWREVNVQKKDSSLVDRALWTQDCGHPFIQVITLRTSAAVWRWLKSYFCQLTLQPSGTGAQVFSQFWWCL